MKNTQELFPGPESCMLGKHSISELSPDLFFQPACFQYLFIFQWLACPVGCVGVWRMSIFVLFPMDAGKYLFLLTTEI